MHLRDLVTRALREPLAHFLLAGLAVFLFFGAFGGEVDVGDRRIVITEERVRRLASQWTDIWQRPPTASELDGLIRDYVKEEIYYREALRLGLDKDDPIVRRRLRSKMEFLATSEAENAVPGDAELQAWLDKYPARYAPDPTYSLEQVYVGTGTGDDEAEARARAILERLRAGAKPLGLGDAIALPAALDRVSASDVTRQFGDEFAAALKPLPKGDWAGPVRSGYGLHLVRVLDVQAPRRPRLAEVRQAVENDWRNATRETRENRAYQLLLDGYRVEIEKPE